MISESSLCPCLSGKSYVECCQLFYFQLAFPESAEKLMRSRYSAYLLVNVPYIVQTTVPAQQSFLDQTAIEEWGKNTNWKGLEIIKHIPFVSKIHSVVEFKAFFATEVGIEAHHERSLFVQIN